MSLGNNLLTLRKKRGLSQEELAEKLNISRQAVSKWESGAALPEMEKIIQICELFDCSIDELVKGKTSGVAEPQGAIGLTKEKYDSFMNKFSSGMALGVGIILLGVTAMLTILSFCPDASQEDRYSLVGTVALMIFVAIAVPIFIIRGLEMSGMRAKYPKLVNYYDEAELEEGNRRFARMMALGVGIILIGLVAYLGLIALNQLDDESLYPVAIFMGFLVVAVPILVDAGVRKTKYNIEAYNKENSVQAKKTENRIGKISGVIMLTATAIYLSISFLFDIWELSWIVFAVAGLLCGIVAVILGGEE